MENIYEAYNIKKKKIKLSSESPLIHILLFHQKNERFELNLS